MDYQGNNFNDFFQTNGHFVLKRVDNNYKLRSFTEKEIEHITDRYSTSLGNGSFGDVYKGRLDDQRPVAVKRYKNGTKKEEFAKEVIVHSQINHKNVVRLLGCCTEENALMIVMEFICNGNLYNILHCGNADGPIPFPLDKRLDIAIKSSQEIDLKIEAISRLKHKNVVQLLGNWVEGNKYVLAYEYVSGGTLHDILHREGEELYNFTFSE
uniref:Tandem kinase 1 splice variant WTK1.2 n=1 Tax=Triticum dicoccoides TaxID=85692 RepID=A0A344NID0_TRIDC|nr:wheat tandem kinase 1 splice variant WTK1.2 [Triticum dicoccoides]